LDGPSPVVTASCARTIEDTAGASALPEERVPMKVSVQATERPSRVLSKLLHAEQQELALSELRLRLCELFDPLQEEWSLKTSSDGLYEQVRDQEPSWSSEIDRLRKEQHEIAGSLRHVIHLCDRSMAILESLELQRNLLARKLRIHESRENQLLLETYFRDVGGE
jgi:hypothetical protein